MKPEILEEMCTMKNYEKPIAEVLLFRLAEVRMVPRISIGEGTDDNYGKRNGGDMNGDQV